MTKLSDFLVVTDVDGTLVRAGLPAPERNVKAVREFREAGGNFTICTGRGLMAAKGVISEFGINIPSIHCNGSLIYKFATGETLKRVTIDPMARECARILMNEFPSLGVEFVVEHEIWTPRINRAIQEHLDKYTDSFLVVSLDDARDGWDKLLLADEPDVVEKMKVFVENEIRPDPRFKNLDFTQSSPYYYEMIPLGINKGKALLELADCMGIEYNNTVGIGDFYNDVPLLETAATTAVVGNAPDDLKAKADYVVSDVMDGGVADLLYMLMDKYC